MGSSWGEGTGLRVRSRLLPWELEPAVVPAGTAMRRWCGQLNSGTWEARPWPAPAPAGFRKRAGHTQGAGVCGRAFHAAKGCLKIN